MYPFLKNYFCWLEKEEPFPLAGQLSLEGWFLSACNIDNHEPCLLWIWNKSCWFLKSVMVWLTKDWLARATTWTFQDVNSKVHRSRLDMKILHKMHWNVLQVKTVFQLKVSTCLLSFHLNLDNSLTDIWQKSLQPFAVTIKSRALVKPPAWSQCPWESITASTFSEILLNLLKSPH